MPNGPCFQNAVQSLPGFDIHAIRMKKQLSEEAKKARLYVKAGLAACVLISATPTTFIHQQRMLSNTALCEKLVGDDTYICGRRAVTGYRNNVFWYWFFISLLTYSYFLIYCIYIKDDWS